MNTYLANKRLLFLLILSFILLVNVNELETTSKKRNKNRKEKTNSQKSTSLTNVAVGLENTNGDESPSSSCCSEPENAFSQVATINASNASTSKDPPDLVEAIYSII